jgi:putative oxidoreductase
MSIVMIALHIYLAWAYRDYYKPLFKSKATVSL